MKPLTDSVLELEQQQERVATRLEELQQQRNSQIVPCRQWKWASAICRRPRLNCRGCAKRWLWPTGQLGRRARRLRFWMSDARIAGR